MEMLRCACFSPYLFKNLSISVIGGCLLFNGKIHKYRVAASTMLKYDVWPSILLTMVGVAGLSPSLTTSTRLDGPRKNPRSIWNIVPGRYAWLCSAGPLAALCCFALSQNRQWKIGVAFGSCGMPSTAFCVLCSTVGDG